MNTPAYSHTDYIQMNTDHIVCNETNMIMTYALRLLITLTLYMIYQ